MKHTYLRKPCDAAAFSESFSFILATFNVFHSRFSFTHKKEYIETRCDPYGAGHFLLHSRTIPLMFLERRFAVRLSTLYGRSRRIRSRQFEWSAYVGMTRRKNTKMENRKFISISAVVRGRYLACVAEIIPGRNYFLFSSAEGEIDGDVGEKCKRHVSVYDAAEKKLLRMREWIYAKRVVIPTPRERINSRILEVRPLTATKKKKEERKGCKKRSFSLKTPSPAELLTLVNTESGSMDSNRLLAGNERSKGKKKKDAYVYFCDHTFKSAIDRSRAHKSNLLRGKKRLSQFPERL